MDKGESRCENEVQVKWGSLWTLPVRRDGMRSPQTSCVQEDEIVNERLFFSLRRVCFPKNKHSDDFHLCDLRKRSGESGTPGGCCLVAVAWLSLQGIAGGPVDCG